MWQRYSSNHTGIDDLSQVNMFLKNFNNWQSLGLEIEIFYSTLKRIEEEQHGVIDKCRTEMLAAWLQLDNNTTKKIYPRWCVYVCVMCMHTCVCVCAYTGMLWLVILHGQCVHSLWSFLFSTEQWQSINSSPVDPKTVMESSKVTMSPCVSSKLKHRDILVQEKHHFSTLPWERILLLHVTVQALSNHPLTTWCLKHLEASGKTHS